MKKSRLLPGKWRNRKEKPTTSTQKSVEDTTLPRLISNARNAYRQWSLYTRCGNLPLDRFIRCACDGDLRALCRKPFIPESAVKAAWRAISEEYAKLSGNTGYERSFLLSKEIAREHSKLVLVRLCLRVLSVRYSKECVDSLANLGYACKFDKDHPDAFRKDLEHVRRNAGMIGLELENKRKQYDKMLVGSKHSSKDSFTQALSVLSKYMGFRVDPKAVTVEEYLSMQKQMAGEVQARASLKNGKVS